MKKVIGVVLVTLGGAVIGAIVMNKMSSSIVRMKEGKINKFKGYYNLLLQWLDRKQEGRSLSEYFTKKGYKRIAIYGMGEVGNRLYNELKNTEVEVKFVIDKNSNATYSPLEVKELEELDGSETVDLIVVTVPHVFEEIQKEVSMRLSSPVVSVEEVIYEL